MSSVFYINDPLNGIRQTIYYNKEDDKVQLLQDVVLDRWENYCNDHWIWTHRFDEYQWNYEDKTKYFLNRCADFLLQGEYRSSNILTDNALRTIVQNEYSISGDWNNDDMEIELENIVDILNDYIKYNHTGDGKIIKKQPSRKRTRPNKPIESKISKMTRIYSQPKKNVVEYESIHISNTFNVWDRKDKKIKARQGLIDPNRPYIAEWCLVDTNNIFEFQGNTYKIHDEVVQYKLRVKKIRYDDYRSDYKMDKILVFEQDDHQYFFDQHIDRLDNELIKTTGGILNYE